MTAKVASIYNPVSSDAELNNGRLTAHVILRVKDIFGKDTFRKVSIGQEFNLNLGTAREMIRTARENNSHQDIVSQFTISL
jgi:hypothetical protein